MTARRSRSAKDAAPSRESTPEGAPQSGEPSFEHALARLEEIVDQLEQGELELEASLAVFEEGVKLSRHCAHQLEAAEQRVEVLVRESGEWTTRPFDAPDDESEDDESPETD
jgi:exodeoxyribonuclease VII small subunit